MTDPIGTAQERELPCDRCGKPEFSHPTIIGIGKACPVSGTTFSNAMSRALQSRIAEVGRLTEVLRRIERKLSNGLANDALDDARAALSLQRRV